MSDARTYKTNRTNHCPRINANSVSLNAAQTFDIRRRAAAAATDAGIPEDVWAAYRAKDPIARDVLMLADPLGERDRIMQETS